jgi:hypothetical protein
MAEQRSDISESGGKRPLGFSLFYALSGKYRLISIPDYGIMGIIFP